MTVCDRGEGGSKIIKNSVTYFMDGPLCVRVHNLNIYKIKLIFLNRVVFMLLEIHLFLFWISRSQGLQFSLGLYIDVFVVVFVLLWIILLTKW